jgi:hypothetical protein
MAAAVLFASSAAFTLQPAVVPGAALRPAAAVTRAGSVSLQMPTLPKFDLPKLFEKEDKSPTRDSAEAVSEEDGKVAEGEEEKMTLEKIASFGIAGVLSIAVAETVFWVLSFPTSELLYFAGTGEWIDLTSQEGQIKFLAFTAGWGALGGVIAQYRTVLTAAAMTPWMDT